MNNYVQKGRTLSLVAPYAVAAGAGALVGSIFGVSRATLGNGETGEFEVEGVFDLVKAGSQAWTVGALIYWDNTNKVCTTTATSNKLIGVAVAAVGAGAGETVGRVRLNGAFIA